MCCFSGPVTSVANTRIFARLLPENRQALIYSMALDTPTDVAMILPIPVAAGSGPDAVKFISLEEYPEIFTHIHRTFPQLKSMYQARRAAPAAAMDAPNLKVHTVGAFDASFVPSVRDFSRLDARFRLPDGVWEKLGQYSRYGFAVFKLRKGKHGNVHPMAFTFPTALPGKRFFPTVHIHDGEVHPKADFDHTLYAQTESGNAPGFFGWEESETLASGVVDLEKARGLISGTAHFFRRKMVGELRNVDVIA
jgi:hypothetical protein